MIKFLLEVEGYDKSIYGVSHVIEYHLQSKLYQIKPGKILIVIAHVKLYHWDVKFLKITRQSRMP